MLTKKKGVLAAAFLGASVLMGACGSASTEETTSLKLSHFWPSHHIVHTQVLEKFGSDLESETNGAVTLELYPGGSLGTPPEQYDLATTGTSDISLSVHGYTSGKFPLVEVMDLPFVVTSSEEGSKKLWELYKEFPELQEEHGDTHPLALFTGEPNQILSKDKPIERLEDLRGLKVRSPSTLGNEILEAVGAVPVSMPVNDIYESLNKGVIDAALAGVSTVNDLNLHEVVDHVTIANLSASSMFITMNKDRYDQLPESEKEKFDALSENLSQQAGAALDQGGQDGLDKADEVGISVIELSSEEQEKFEKALQPVIDDWIKTKEAEGLPGQSIYDAATAK
ncbi:TRAP transporter substrate-binding protein [Bhargavaea ginsengi]|uniref:TRAP transporter substrate-binding protein n=1 Tax=Bhargavaea ginsengi TaxID=426757 RepID=UPI00203C6E6B|nr:TRAP transporter substrate-binding protein [Bhargavaea ginsengi]MCM3088641.1 TRAP transporter substrate-binding protein [Bhargavaea ginsengi]